MFVLFTAAAVADRKVFELFWLKPRTFAVLDTGCWSMLMFIRPLHSTAVLLLPIAEMAEGRF